MDAIWSTYNVLSEKSDTSDDTDDSKCPNCQSVNLVNDTAEGIQVCTDCGNILQSSMLDSRSEWIFMNNDSGVTKDSSRCGCPIDPLLEKSSMSTIIKSNKFSFMKRLHNQMSMDYVERSRYHVFERIQKMAMDVGKLSKNVVDQAKYFYKIMSERKLSRGVIRQGLIACCILYACKYCNVHRSVKEISVMTSVTIPTLNKTTKIFVKLMADVLSSKNTHTHNEKYEFQATESTHLISRFCNLVEIEDRNERAMFMKHVRQIDEDLKTRGTFDCKTPSAITAGIIVYVCEQRYKSYINKTELSKLFNVSLVTINKIMKVISEQYPNL